MNSPRYRMIATALLTTLFFSFTQAASADPNGGTFNPFSAIPTKEETITRPTASNQIIPQVNFTNSDIAMALQIISDATGWSIFPSENASKAKISLWAKNITAQQLLDTVVQLSGFIYHRNGNVISVMTYEEYMQYYGLEKRIFQLKNGNATTVETAIKPFLSKIGKSIVHKDSNTIVLYESEANMKYVSSLVQELDIPMEATTTVVISLSYAQADPLAQTLTQLFDTPKESPQQVIGNPDSKSASPQPQQSTILEEVVLHKNEIKILPVESSNQIVLVGSNLMVEKAQDLISKLDIKGDNLALEVIDLKFVDAVVVENTLRQMFNDNLQKQNATSALFTNQKSTVTPDSPSSPSETILNPEAPVGIYAIGRTNQVIVKAFRPDMEIIKGLIKKLDTYVEPVTKSYHFSYVDVSEIYSGLEKIMTIYAGYNSSTVSFSSSAGQYGNSGSAGSGYGRSGITLVEKSNSVLLTAPPSAHRIMESIKDSIDTPSTFETGMIRVYKIENASVEEIASSIKEILLSQEKETGESVQAKFTPNSNTPSTQPATATTKSEEVISKIQNSVSINKSTNSVVVMATGRQQREIEQLIAELDKRRRQVLIEAKIIEITTSDNLNLGVELNHTKDDISLFTQFGLSNNLDPTTGTRDIIVNNGGTAAVLKPENVQMILQALQTNSNTRISSSPQILVNDNAPGIISSTIEVPYTTTTQGTNSDQVTLGGYVKAGTEFMITPHISEKGIMRVEYLISLSSFTDTSSNSDIPPPKSISSIQSEATVPNGYTIIVGGLKRTDDIETVNKIPLLGDIPVLGWAFKSTKKEKTYKTIFLFITPTILSRDEFQDLKSLSNQAYSEVNPQKTNDPNSPDYLKQKDNTSNER